ncbi:alanine--tRNA ligase [Capillimicrobium parvum]|uniref:Alanine--tRNA ligase n=1 Tax=Capillimicrobium parvum TaxID=2884022 RepID=A0A9E6Y007_9ACTN|nr:alanine--tRNA ligase [Capillimicrobium parvum]UGS37132.1 Alanine--tRNA ligase [Capillimicrobium parvum]
MTSDEIRETFLSFFEQRGHRRLPSASLVPAAFDPSVLLTTAGMHPLKPYFLGQEAPPAPRLTSCQKVFRTPDIDIVGTTTRHLTFFEMLGNFSMGDYFKQGAVEFAWDLSLNGFGFDPEQIWITVFEGDDELGLGPDEEAISAWEAVGVPRERIVLCPRSENFWQAGPIGPCGPCSELYYDRGLDWGAPDDLPGGENERFLEYWNLVFMQFNQDPVNDLTPLPAQNIDTGLGLNRMAVIQQGTDTVFETDQFLPLVQLGEELSGRTYGESFEVDRALRILADHTRGMTFLVADGVVPSNEDRGYVLRRIMRRAIQQGRSLGIEGTFLPRFSERVTELMGAAYPELHEQRESIDKWLRAEEESFGRTLEQGTRMLSDIVARARENGEEGVGADDLFRLHDTFGFPFDLSRELLAQEGLGSDEEGFETLMAEQRERSRSGSGGKRPGGLAGFESLFGTGASLAPTRFTGYDTLEQGTEVTRVGSENGHVAVKLAESPFYAAGGGQISDAGVIECADGDCRARVVDVVRIGDDQAVLVEPERGQLRPGERVYARVDRDTRLATMANHTATHLLHAALRRSLGGHVRQAGSYVGPDKLRFDFTHGSALSPDELHAVEDQVNAWIVQNWPVQWRETTLDEAKAKGAMALFGEKYGDVVRMVEVGDGSFSRELCGGTHVRSTAEIGAFRVTAETSSAANVRRIEAVTGRDAIALLRRHDAYLRDVASMLRTRPDDVPAKLADLQAKAKAAAKGGAPSAGAGVDVEALLGEAEAVDGARVLTARVEAADNKALLHVLDRVKPKLGDAAVVLGAAADGKVMFVASVAPALVERGVKAGEIVRLAAEVTGGGGGGRDTMAQAGGRDPGKLDEALGVAREAIERRLGG